MKKLYFICPNNNHITGGVKQIYRQVEFLNKHGIPSYILQEKITKNNWFSSDIPIKYSPYIFKLLRYLFEDRRITFRKKLKLSYLKKISEKINKDSVLVFPEIYGSRINEILPNIPKVIFNQGCYLTFNGFSINKNYPQNPYNHKDTIATIVASDDALSYMNYAFPNTKTYKITLGINHSIFNYSDKKQKQICFMPRKLMEDARQVILILKLRKNLKDWKFIPIENKNEKEVAQIMKESTFFLNFNRCEGFGLPAAEAMACGCYVIGYHGQGGKEYFKPEFSSIVESGDIIQYVNEIEKIVKIYDKNPNLILEKGKQASNFILSNYSMKMEEKSSIDVWRKILDI